MAVKNWVQRYHTGIPTIDQHHDVMLDRMDALYGALIDKQPSKVIDGLIASVIEVAIEHFAEEEKEMVRSNYGESAAHLASHQDFRVRLQQVRDHCKAGRTVSLEALDLINRYLGDHIKTHDMVFARHMGAK